MECSGPSRGPTPRLSGFFALVAAQSSFLWIGAGQLVPEGNSRPRLRQIDMRDDGFGQGLDEAGMGVDAFAHVKMLDSAG